MTRSRRARANRFLTSVTSTSTVSPTSTKGTNTTKSPTRPTPSPPKAMSLMAMVKCAPMDGAGAKSPAGLVVSGDMENAWRVFVGVGGRQPLPEGCQAGRKFSNPKCGLRMIRVLLVFVRDLFIVPPQDVVTEIIFQIAPHGVNVIGVVLRVIVFDQESRPLDAVVVRLSRLQSAGPGKMDLVQPGVIDFPHIIVG